MSRKQNLRTGFTTGSAAAAGAKAATLVLCGLPVPQAVDIPLPGEDRKEIPVHQCTGQGPEVRCTVIKDGGDDPDATHLARISTCVAPVQDQDAGDFPEVHICGGQGVGVVTKPGLPVPVGQAAINPAPREQIRRAVLEAMHTTGYAASLRVTVEVEDGERIAAKTLNPRLGIAGGISILGTRGTVLPFSCQAYEQTIATCLDAARAQGVSGVALCTGGRSERFYRNLHPDMPQAACILVADFLAFSLAQAVKRDFEQLTSVCFFGKLVKAAQGHPYTHAKTCSIDFEALAACCRDAGLSARNADQVQKCNTARQALEIIRAVPGSEPVIQAVAARALSRIQEFAGRRQGVEVVVFDDQGHLVVSCSSGSASPQGPCSPAQ